MVGKVNPPPGSNSQPGTYFSNMPDPSAGKMGEMYSAKNNPAVAEWFKKQFPNLSEKDLNKAVAGWMKNEIHYLQTLMKRLDRERKKAMEKARRDEEGG